ncbi:MAG TPA: M1 family aminopeptidase, partial [Chryseosolibacter sp.]|nr:M1 family aminopeptidase [Chryseosolibacter sp.]
ILHPQTAFVETLEWKADYEKKYRKFADKPQPRLIKTKLQAEIYPRKRAVEFRGAYGLVNMTRSNIDTIHISTAPGVENHSISFDRSAKPVLVDEELDYRMYILDKPLSPGDSLKVEFHVTYNPQGFPNSGVNISVVKNGSYFANFWLPSIGYQDGREILNPDDRKMQGLGGDSRIIEEIGSEGGERIDLEVIVGTDKGQIAVGPGKLLKSWQANGRSYFHYATESPVKNKFGLFSADYHVVEAWWKADSGKTVDIKIFHHPEHTLNLDRIAKGVQASLTHLTREYGPYPHSEIRFLEVPGYPKGLFAYPMNILYREGFALLNPDKDSTKVDIPFATVAHEVSHQWWGSQVSPAPVKGAALLTESLAWYSALEIVEEAKGRKEFLGLIGGLQDDYFSPKSRADEPLLSATEHHLIYRKGPLALFAMRAYIGGDQMRKALLSLFKKNATGNAPLPLPSDLYKELQAVTPDSMKYLLHDLFAANTFWELKTERAVARQTESGLWKVTLEVQAKKFTVDTNGIDTDVEMNDLIQIGMYGGNEKDGEGQELYLNLHRIRPGKQTIEIELQGKPSFGGIDPKNLLMDLKRWDNTVEIEY